MPSWGRGNSPNIREEMSCSYLPSKKAREELITDYARHYPNMSDDISERILETPSLSDENYDQYNESDDLIDASELRRRTRRNGSVLRSDFAYPPSPTRR